MLASFDASTQFERAWSSPSFKQDSHVSSYGPWPPAVHETVLPEAEAGAEIIAKQIEINESMPYYAASSRMNAMHVAESAFMRAADVWAAAWPAPQPTFDQAMRSEVVAHRGAHAPGIPENTVPAFDRANAAGCWGIEFDVRFSRDDEAVICHDPDLRRVFGIDAKVAELTADELIARAPGLARLSDVVDRYAARRHLMIELKSDALPGNERQRASFRNALAQLEPGRDWHLLALQPPIFAAVPWLAAQACLPVAQMQVASFSQQSLQNGWAGISGHFALIGDRRRQRHAARGQKVGVGHIHSEPCLRREIARGADWLFTNDAVDAQNWLLAARKNGSRP